MSSGMSGNRVQDDGGWGEGGVWGEGFDSRSRQLPLDCSTASRPLTPPYPPPSQGLRLPSALTSDGGGGALLGGRGDGWVNGRLNPYPIQPQPSEPLLQTRLGPDFHLISTRFRHGKGDFRSGSGQKQVRSGSGGRWGSGSPCKALRIALRQNEP